MMKRILSLGLLLGSIVGSVSADTIMPLPQMADGNQWDVPSADRQRLQVATVDSALEVTFEVDSGAPADLILRSPVDIPDETDDLAFLLNADPKSPPFNFDVIIEDRGGKQWYALTKLPGASAYRRSLSKVDPTNLKGRTMRISTPALSQAVTAHFRDGGGASPRPWKLIGFRFSGNPPADQAKPGKVPAQFYLRNFALTHQVASHSAYGGVRGEISGAPIAYGGNRVEFCTELDGDPGVAVYNFYKGSGLYQVAWDVYDDYAGAPVDSGAGSVSVEQSGNPPPLALQLAQVVKYSRRAPGTHWARWRVHYFPSGKVEGSPAEIVSGEERLYVDQAAKAPVAEVKATLEPGWVAIHPKGTSFVSETSAAFGVKVEARRPAATVTKAKIQLTVRSNHLHTEVKKLSLPLDFSGGDVAEVTADLSSLSPGPYKVEAALVADGEVTDRAEVLAGIRNAAGSSAPLTKLPAGVLDWKQALTRKNPYFHLSPMWHSATWLMPGHTRWDWFKNFLEQASTVSRDIEYETPWSILEPLPGVFDWEEMDLFLNKSKELGLQVLVWPGFWGEEPAWLPSVPGQARDGHIFFDFVYDFYGIRQDYANSPVLQNALLSAVHSIVDHTRDHPAVQGYFLIQELPGDASFANWMGGYGKTEKVAYREEMKARFQSPEALSARWGRPVQNFEEIEPPTDQASSREWLDWLLARANACDIFMQRLLAGVRKDDPLRPIFVYGDVFGTSLKTSEMAPMGCAKANGGSHDAMHPFLVSSLGQHGILQRTEDHWPGKWTGYFPEVLEASVFAMSYGGGLAMNCKAYMFTYLPELGRDHLIKLDELRKPPFSLDLYEKFMPIWSAMRPAQRMPVEVVELLDTEAGLLNNKALTRNGFWDGEAQLACYRSQINFAADEFPGAGNGKLLMMVKDGLDNLTRERIEQIKSYVAGGGNLLMLAEGGRKCVDEPKADWVLLRETGFSEPTVFALVKGTAIATPAKGQTFDPALERFSIGGQWPHKPVGGETVIATNAANAVPLLTWKQFGKGRIAVIWGDQVIPRGSDKNGGNVLKAAAQWAGAADVMNSALPSFWMNLLRNPATNQYFGLAHAGQWQGKPNTPSKGKVSYKVDPGTSYHVTELVTGKDLGTHPGGVIWSEGIEITLTPRQTAVLQFDPVAAVKKP